MIPNPSTGHSGDEPPFRSPRGLAKSFTSRYPHYGCRVVVRCCCSCTNLNLRKVLPLCRRNAFRAAQVVILRRRVPAMLTTLNPRRIKLLCSRHSWGWSHILHALSCRVKRHTSRTHLRLRYLARQRQRCPYQHCSWCCVQRASDGFIHSESKFDSRLRPL